MGANRKQRFNPERARAWHARTVSVSNPENMTEIAEGEGLSVSTISRAIARIRKLDKLSEPARDPEPQYREDKTSAMKAYLFSRISRIVGDGYARELVDARPGSLVGVDMDRLEHVYLAVMSTAIDVRPMSRMIESRMRKDAQGRA